MLPEMEPFTIGALSLASATAFFWTLRVLREGNQRKTEVWAHAAERLGLHASPATVFHRPTISGLFGDLTVAIGLDDRQSNLVYAVKGLPATITLQSESFFATPFAALTGKGDLRTGDAAFDSAVHVGGAERSTLSLLLSPDVRRLALEAIKEHDAVLMEGTLSLESSNLDPNAAELVRLAQILMGLARAIVEQLAIPDRQRLLKGVRTQDGPVAHRALELLVERNPNQESTIAACQEMLQYVRDPATRLLAARHAGNAGMEHLTRLLENLNGTPAELRAGALEHLVATMPVQESRVVLDAGLRDVMRPVRLAAMRAVRDQRRMECTDRLATLAGHGGVDEEEQTAIAETMSELGGDHAERAFVSLLRSDASSVRLLAATALREHGTIAAVAPLRAVAEASGILSTVRTAALESIAAIQAQIPGGGSGQLSLASDEFNAKGAVSLTGTRGALSTVPDDPKRRGDS